MATCIAFLRGINVGKAKRIAMADLRALVEGLGCTNVRTVLNSGNAIFDVSRPNPIRIAVRIEAAIQASHGFSTSVVVLTAVELDAVIRENPLVSMVPDPSRHLVAFVPRLAVLAAARPLLATKWKPEALALGSKAGYLGGAGGILDSALLKAFSRAAGGSATTRNWSTVLKVRAMAGGDPDA